MRELDKNEIMILADDYAHKYAFVGYDEMPKARNALAQAIIGQFDKIARLEAELAPYKRRAAFVNNSYISFRDGDELFDSNTGQAFIDAYRIMPLEDFREIEAECAALRAELGIKNDYKNNAAMQVGEKL